MNKQKQIEELTNKICSVLFIKSEQPNCSDCYFSDDCGYKILAEELLKYYQPKIPENAVVLTDDELNEVIDTCKVSMIVTDDDGEKYISLDDHNEYTERLGKIVRQRKARIEYLEKLLDDRCDRCIERVRKETAEKIINELWAFLGSRQMFVVIDEETKTLIELSPLWKKVVELAKKNGVEVKE